MSGALCIGATARAASIVWKGHTWQVTSGGMAGVCQGDPSNVTIDGDGYLHLRISKSAAGWSASELFTTDLLGFGTYQWQIDGPIDSYDKNVVLGLFPYGPAAGIGGDGTNEIDIEYSRWGQASGPNGDWTNYPASGKTIGELSYSFSLGGATLSTSRFIWLSDRITDSISSGLQPVDGTGGLIKSWNYMPPNPSVNIPQRALPLGMNLWCFDSPPSDGNPVEIVLRDFVFVPAVGSGDGGGSGSGAGGRGGGGGIGGTSGGAGGVVGASGGADGQGGRAASTGGGPGGAGQGGPGGAKAGMSGSAGSAASGGGAGGVPGEAGGTGGSAHGGVAGGPSGGGAASNPGVMVANSSGGCTCAVGARGARDSSTAGWLSAALSILILRTRRRPPIVRSRAQLPPFTR